MEQIVHIHKSWSDDGWYVDLSEVNEALADGWRVKMLSSYGAGTESLGHAGAFVVLENDD